MAEAVGSGGSAFDTMGDRRPSAGLSRLAAHNSRNSPPHAIGTLGVTDFTYEADAVNMNPLTAAAAVRPPAGAWFTGSAEGAVRAADVQPAIELTQPKAAKANAEAQADGEDTAEVRLEERTPPEDLGYDTVAEERRAWLRDFLEDPDSSKGAKVLSLVILGLICVSTVGLIVETLPTFDNTEDKQKFFIIESICIGLFTVEYVLRLGLAADRVAFSKNGMNVIDFVSIIPYYFDLLIWSITGTPPYASDGGGASDLTRVLRLFRLVRVFRVFKLGRNSRSLFIAFKSVLASLDTLGLMVFILFIMLVLFGAFVYSFEVGDWEEQCSVAGSDPTEGCYKVEGEGGVDVISLFISVPEAMWWCVVTVMTVGYGELYPLTPLGKTCAGVCMVSSIVILALPISVIGINFSAMWTAEEQSREMKKDPFKLFECGQNLDQVLGEFLGATGFYLDRLAEVHKSIRTRTRKIMNDLRDLRGRDSPGEASGMNISGESEDALDHEGVGSAVLLGGNDPIARAQTSSRLLALKLDEVYMQASYERIMTFFPLQRLEAGGGPAKREEARIGMKKSMLRTKINGQMILSVAKEVRLVEAELRAMKQFVNFEGIEPCACEGETSTKESESM